MALAKPRPLRLKIRSRKKLPHLEAHTLDIAPFEGAQLQMTMRELIDDRAQSVLFSLVRRIQPARKADKVQAAAIVDKCLD